jgi:peptidyl-prolyl cis-trans isomerase B (cyclophilin B)
MFAPRRLLCCSAVLSLSAALSACGSSESGAAATAASHSTSSRTGGGRARAGGTCERVQAPASKGAQRMPAPRQALDPSRRYVVTLTTNCGRIAIELDVRRAPRTTSSFAYLVRRRFYDNLTFHRVAAGYLIQGGDPNGDGSGGPGYTVVEPPPSSLRYTLGTVAMAKTEADPPGASGSQFFIVTGRQTSLPAQFALVGRVVGGLSAVRSIGQLTTDPPQDGAPTTPVVISATSLSVLG